MLDSLFSLSVWYTVFINSNCPFSCWIILDTGYISPGREIHIVSQTDNEKRLSNNFFLTASPLSNKLWQIIYDRLSIREEIGFTVSFLLKRKNKRLPQIIFLSLASYFFIFICFFCTPQRNYTIHLWEYNTLQRSAHPSINQAFK